MKTQVISKKSYDNLQHLLEENNLIDWKSEECTDCLTDVQIIRRLEKQTSQRIKYIGNKIVVI